MAVTAKVLDTGEVLIPAKTGKPSGWPAGAELGVETRGSEIILRRKSTQDEARRREEMILPIRLDEFFGRVPKVTCPRPSDKDERFVRKAHALPNGPTVREH